MEAHIAFLVRDPLYRTTKPYAIRFDPQDDTPRSNITVEKRAVVIHDARTMKTSLEENGFTLTTFPSEMKYEDFGKQHLIERIYAKELEGHLTALLGASRVVVIDYVVRRRHLTFPISTGENYDSQQPARLAHVDFSYAEGVNMLKTMYGDGADEVLQHHWQIINAWRPINGPVYDWPLAVCDSTTFNLATDAEVSDAVYPGWSYENLLVHHLPEQKWSYYSQMTNNETMLFKCVDSDESLVGPCPHAAFPIPQMDSTETFRESIESRAFILWAPVEMIPAQVGTVYGIRN